MPAKAKQRLCPNLTEPADGVRRGEKQGRRDAEPDWRPLCVAAMSFFGFGKKDSLQDELFNLKFASKQLAKDSKKADKEMHKEKDKVKKALEAGREDIAQIHASNAIMHKNTSKNYLMMSSRIEAVSAKLNAAIKNQQVTGSMAQITKTMGKVLKTMSLSDIQKTMDKFEKEFENADVATAAVEGAMQSSTSMTTPKSEIDELVAQVKDENQMDTTDKLGVPLQGGVKNAAASQAETTEDDELMARLAKLKAPQ